MHAPLSRPLRKYDRAYHQTAERKARKLLADAKYRREHRDRKNAQNRAYRARHPEAANASSKKWYTANYEYKNSWQRQYDRRKRLAWRQSPAGQAYLAKLERWAKARELKAEQKRKRKDERQKGALAFPYLRNSRSEYSDYLALNALVAQGLPGREDAVHDMVLAVLEGSATLAALQSDRAAVRAFCRKHMRDNFEAGGYAISFDQPDQDGKTLHDRITA